MEVQLLGPVELRADTGVMDPGMPRQRAVLAALAADAGRVVSVDTLVERVWGDDPPARARRTLHTYIARLRGLLGCSGADGEGAARLLRRPGGYELDVDPDRVDLHRFRRLVNEARGAATSERARLALLREAIALHRGQPLAGLSGDWVERMRRSWQQQHADAVVAWAHAELHAGDPAAVLGPLRDLAAQQPLDEPLASVLMRVLVKTGRSSDALGQFADIRRRLADELGADPGPELQALHQAILRGQLTAWGDTQLPAAQAQPAQSHAVPAQLPRDVPAFTGRDSPLCRLDGLLSGSDGVAAVAVIATIEGMAGVGKTALAVHWAHRVADRFPDGQLYANLRGFDPGGRAMDPAEAVHGFLDALGVPPERIPPGVDARVGLYRSLLAGKRILVLLDNARDADQVRPLLPGTPTALAVVTSRNQLTPLVAEGAHPLILAPLSFAEAWELLVRRLGTERVTEEPAAIEAIVAACARLPLALNIAAARIQQTGFPAAAIAAELADAERRLDALDAGDTASQLRAVFSWSYTALTPPAARLFRLLGLHLGPDVSLPAAASLAGQPAPDLRRLLTEILRASLITEPSPGRYTFHDLLRAYAADLTATDDPEPERRAALRRLLDHYTQTCHAAELLLRPHRDPMAVPLAPPARGARPEHIADRPTAIAWLAAERPVLLATVRQAAEAGFDTHAWQLAWALDTFLDWRGHWQEMVAIWRTALHAARRQASPTAQAYAHRLLARAQALMRPDDDAHANFRRALDLYTETGDLVGQADTYRTLAYLCERQDRPQQALSHSRQALALYQTAGHPRGQAYCLNAIGWYHSRAGQHAQAITHCQAALTLFHQLGDRFGQASTWDSLGHAHHHLGHHALAAGCYRSAAALRHSLGDRYNEATTLVRLGDTQHAAGDSDAARTAWQDALDILTDLAHPDAAPTRTKLHSLDRHHGATCGGQGDNLPARGNEASA